MDKARGLEVLIEVVKNNKTHQDYKRVTDLASKYYKYTTGDKLNEELEQIITRETDDEIKQRRKITNSVCPPVINSTKIIYQKAIRKPPVVRKIDYEGDNETKKIELEKFIGKYWGDQSLEKYMGYAFVDYNYTDPNAFLITEFSNFNNLKEKASPYPFVATSEEAIMFEYKNEILEYLVVKLPIKYLDKETLQDGAKYTIYLGLDTIVFIQISESDFRVNQINGIEVIEIEKKFYLVNYFEPKNEKVPAKRFGFIRDTETKGRTFVSLFHHGWAYLKKTLKIDSELDLSTSMCAFQQRFAYVSPCQNKGCNHGVLLDGSGTCPDCGGTGKQPFHRGTMDIITLELPKDPNEIIDLERLQVTKGPLIELLDFQKEYLEYLKNTFHKIMFNSDVATNSDVAKSVTATVANFGEDYVNDTLFPFTQHYSSFWEFVVKDIATFTDLGQGLVVQLKYPYDLKMKGLSELMTELKMAKDAGASTSTISAIEDDINEILYSDRPEALKEMRVKNKINPFRGVNNADIRFIISQNNVPLYTRTLWENFESIWQDLEVKYSDPWLFDMAEEKISELVRAKTEEYMALISGETEAQAAKEAEVFAKQNPFNK